MQYIKGLEHYDNARKTAVTFGKFDGLHKGHMTLVDTVKKLQDKDDVDSVVCAFDMDSAALLMLPQERQIHLEDEVDYLVECPFTDEIRQMRAEDFIRNIIIGTFHAAYVVVGTDFQFGYNKEGDIYMLDKFQERYGYRLIVLEKIRYENHIISSTYTKKILGTGNMDLVGRLLGYSYGICGTVEHGHKLGRTLGFPTMNIAWPKRKIIPPRGVYLCRAYMDGYGYNGIANVGVRPTVSNEEKVWLETFLFDYEADAYGKEVMVELIEFVRPEQKFENKEELKARVDKDIASGRQYFKI